MHPKSVFFLNTLPVALTESLCSSLCLGVSFVCLFYFLLFFGHVEKVILIIISLKEAQETVVLHLNHIKNDKNFGY